MFWCQIQNWRWFNCLTISTGFPFSCNLFSFYTLFKYFFNCIGNTYRYFVYVLRFSFSSQVVNDYRSIQRGSDFTTWVWFLIGSIFSGNNCHFHFDPNMLNFRLARDLNHGPRGRKYTILTNALLRQRRAD